MTILGVDVSVWQGAMNWPKAVSAGARFAFIRAGSINSVTGICYTDYQWTLNLLARAHLPVGYYWYFRGNHDPIKQADYFSTLVKATGSRVLWCDVEEQGGLTPEALRDSIAKFIGRVYSNLSVWCGIYTRTNLWNPHSILVNGVYVKAGVAESALWPKLPLWVARYGVTAPWVYGSSYKLRDWTTWNAWQFSADGNGRGREFGGDCDSIDLNYFNGSEQDLAQFFGTTVNVPVVTKPLYPRLVTANYRDSRPIRYEPTTEASLHGSIASGLTVVAYADQVGPGGDLWLRLTPTADKPLWTAWRFNGVQLMRDA
jgi:lysozyme